MNEFYIITKELVSQCSTPNEVVVLMELLHWESIARANGKKTYTTTNGYIAKTHHISTKTVERTKQSLKDKGLIDYTVNIKEDKTKETIYTVLQRESEEKKISTKAQKALINKNKKCIINNKPLTEASKTERTFKTNNSINTK